MKKLLTILMPVFLAGYTQTDMPITTSIADSPGMMQGQIMKRCQGMTGDGMMKQCPMMQQGKMDGGMMQGQGTASPTKASPSKTLPKKPAGTSEQNHKEHHPAAQE